MPKARSHRSIGVHVAALHHGLGRDHLLAEAALFAAFRPARAGCIGVHHDHPQQAVQIAIVEDVAFPHQARINRAECPPRAPTAGLFTFDLDTIVQQTACEYSSRLDQAGYFHPESRTATQFPRLIWYAGLHSTGKNNGGTNRTSAGAEAGATSASRIPEKGRVKTKDCGDFW